LAVLGRLGKILKNAKTNRSLGDHLSHYSAADIIQSGAAHIMEWKLSNTQLEALKSSHGMCGCFCRRGHSPDL
jgi:hypothetical protein